MTYTQLELFPLPEVVKREMDELGQKAYVDEMRLARQDFEETFCRDRHMNTKQFSTGVYFSQATQLAWEAWWRNNPYS